MSTSYEIALLKNISDILTPVSVAPDNQNSTNAYADVAGSKIDSYGKTRVVFTILNAHATAGIKWKVLASVDDVTYIEVKAEAVLAGAASSSYVASATDTSFRYFKIQIASNVADTPGTAKVRGYSKI